MARSLYSAGNDPTRFYFPDGQDAGETYRIVHNAGDGLGSILAKRYRVATERNHYSQDVVEFQSFQDIASAHGWIAEGLGATEAWDRYFAEPIDAPAEPPTFGDVAHALVATVAAAPPVAEKAKPSGRRPRAVTSSAD